MEKNIEYILKQMIKENLKLPIDASEIALDTKLTQIGLNSINFIKLIAKIETEFEFEFDVGALDIEAFETLEDLLKLITEMKSSM